MPRNKLAKLLLEDQSTESSSGQHVNTFGVDQIINIQEELNRRLHEWDQSVGNYNPLFEIAKLALCTDSEDLRFKCHARLADHLYPQVKSLEIQSKQDREVKISIEIAGYAKAQKDVELSSEDIQEIETEGDIDEEETLDHTEWVLKQNIKKNAD
jgi:hypothetical protein